MRAAILLLLTAPVFALLLPVVSVQAGGRPYYGKPHFEHPEHKKKGLLKCAHAPRAEVVESVAIRQVPRPPRREEEEEESAREDDDRIERLERELRALERQVGQVIDFIAVQTELIKRQQDLLERLESHYLQPANP